MTKKNSNNNKFPVVGIGGSAGAFEAIREIVDLLPSHTGMAFVYLQHVTPDHDSKMVPLLAKRAKLPVLDAEEGMPLEPDFFYVVPPGKELMLADGSFKVTQRPAEGYDYMPINRFFGSLAENYQEYAIGILLSGADGDGALGMKAIKSGGGFHLHKMTRPSSRICPKRPLWKALWTWCCRPGK